MAAPGGRTPPSYNQDAVLARQQKENGRTRTSGRGGGGFNLKVDPTKAATLPKDMTKDLPLRTTVRTGPLNLK